MLPCDTVKRPLLRQCFDLFDGKWPAVAVQISVRCESVQGATCGRNYSSNMVVETALAAMVQAGVVDQLKPGLPNIL